jgi:site-specific DNA-methyltransferase (adenine-specific)
MATRPKIEMVEIDQVKLNPRNPRLNDAAVAPVAESIRRFGFRQPIVVNRRTGQIEAGNTRWRAAKQLGLDRVPVIWVDDDEAQAMAFSLADNRTHEFATWDEAALAAQLKELDAQACLLASAFNEDDLGELLARLEAETKRGREETFDADQAMAEAAKHRGPTRVKLGELWELGKHRLLCGDATALESWQRLMGGEKAHAVITDPPYGINYVGGRAVQQQRISKRRRGSKVEAGDAYWDDLTPEQYRALLNGALALAYEHSDDKAPLYLWFASSHLRSVLECMAGTGWAERNLIVWVKNNGAGALFAQYKHWYEPCFYAHKQGKAPRWHGPTNERTVWEHDKPAVNDLHRTMKPLALIERTIENATKPGQLVVDPFLGSGTAIIAAERTGRRCFGFDLEPRYCDVMLARWEAFAGASARLVGGSGRAAKRARRRT